MLPFPQSLLGTDGVSMIQELTRGNYLGVLCFSCRERIPVPKKTAVLYEELKQGEVSDGHEVTNRAMTLRCKACDGESVYSIDEILEFESPPRVRTSEKKRDAKAS
jgi:hypothetical protein